MLKDNILMLRNLNGYSQEQVADEIGISRQAYGKWEKGETIPDVEKCALLASFYGTTVDTLINFETEQEGMTVPPAPKGKYIFGTVSMSERGQIVIPKEARDKMNFAPGDRLVILGDENEGLGIVKAEIFEQKLKNILKQI